MRSRPAARSLRSRCWRDMRVLSEISSDPRFLRLQIREGILAACSHGDACGCPQRRQWETAILEIYRSERAGKQQPSCAIEISVIA